ncbi:LysM domain-containing protein [Dysgonomonas sp. 511]|uniref:LysM peptidoglycan-binding domain-containing protein n=1 Tax=Dysgonomonas sp. 511 TaxID=2302930 RepID=UPI0013D66547|nr:LysM domain-containing protein [Dysgonomonas sp. 511]NDV78620.1 LysM domain-containing protein [Dysgonomonas sp. 511]
MRIKNLFTFFFILTASCLLSNASILTANEEINTNGRYYTSTPQDGIITYTVKKGDTVFGIANAHGTTVEEIYELNPKAAKGIKEGDKLKIKKSRKAARHSNHLIESGETLFSVSRMYSISENELRNANPGLDKATFRTGKTIKIPVYENTATVATKVATVTATTASPTTHKVGKGETLYGIGKKYDVPVASLLGANPQLEGGVLKEGNIINIPAKNTAGTTTTASVIRTNDGTQTSVLDIPFASSGETVKVGILLPFLEEKGNIKKDKLIEYYEGFLLSLETLKKKGLNAEVYTFDIGNSSSTERLESLLETAELRSLHLIIGGVSKEQIAKISTFSKKTGIKYAIPFGTSKEMLSTPSLYQMTSLHSNLYDEINAGFIKQFNDYNIVFVSESGSKNDKEDFVKQLKKALTESSVTFKTIDGSDNLLADIKNSLNIFKKNILVPTSASEATLRKILSSAKTLSGESFTLFGYPEWQTYTQHLADLQKYNSYIYSIFYLNEQDQAVQEVASEYKKWYNKEIINSFPKYAYLGYDTGLYFFSALNKYGSDFSPHIKGFSVPTLQSAIHFENKDDKNSGFVNKGLYFIQFKSNGSVAKTDVSK